MLDPGRRVKVDLAQLTLQGVHFSENVREVPGTVVRALSADPEVYLVELLFSFKGIRRVELPAARVHHA